VKREIVVDRRSGDIGEVRVFDRRGLLVVRSRLEDYRPVPIPAAGGDTSRGSLVRFPYHLRLEYPSQKVQVVLTLEKVTVPAQMGEIQTPDFEEQGLQVRRVD
jgi:hypothetical protein